MITNTEIQEIAQEVEKIAPEILTPQQLADYLQVPLSWVYSRSRFSHINGFPVLRVGKYTRYRKKDVDDWLEKNQGIG